jgi:hypothetical protein
MPTVRASALPGSHVHVEQGDEEITFRGPLPSNPPRLFIADAYGAQHFCSYVSHAHAAAFVETGPSVTKKALSSSSPFRLVIFWDSSKSRGDMNHEDAFRLLANLEAALSEQGRTAQVTVYAFDVSPRVLAQADSMSAAVAVLRGLNGRYDGGTDLSCLKEVLAETANHDCHLLFSDGSDNLGSARALQLAQAAGVSKLHVALVSQAKAPVSLAALAHTTGGACARAAEPTLPQVLCGTKHQLHIRSVQVEGVDIEDLADEALETVPDCRLSRQHWPILESGLRVSGRLGAAQPSGIEVSVAVADQAGRLQLEM